MGDRRKQALRGSEDHERRGSAARSRTGRGLPFNGDRIGDGRRGGRRRPTNVTTLPHTLRQPTLAVSTGLQIKKSIFSVKWRPERAVLIMRAVVA